MRTLVFALLAVLGFGAAPQALAQGTPAARPAAAPTASTPIPAKWQAGRHYRLLNPSVPTNVAPGKVEVVEVFWYGCGACYMLDPYLESWKKTKPAAAELVRLGRHGGGPRRGDAPLSPPPPRPGRPRGVA